MATSANEEAQNVAVSERKNEKKMDDNNDGTTTNFFKNSSHQYAIGNYGLTSIIGWIVIVLQLGLYIVCLNIAGGDTRVGSNWVIPVKVRFGKRCTDSSQLVCPPTSPSVIYYGLAAVILGFFLMRDIFIPFVVICKDYKNKHVPGMIAAFIICINGILGIIAGLILIISASDAYDAFVAMVPIVLISLMDKAAFQTFDEFDVSVKWVPILAFVLFILIVFGAGIGAGASLNGVRKDNIIDLYGEDYWEARFSSGGYIYKWPGDWDSTFDWESWGYSAPSSPGYGASGYN